MADERAPRCTCCAGQGMHSFHPNAVGSTSPDDDWEGCTACGETGRTWHDRVYPNTCEGAKTLARRNRSRV